MKGMPDGESYVSIDSTRKTPRAAITDRDIAARKASQEGAARRAATKRKKRTIVQDELQFRDGH